MRFALTAIAAFLVASAVSIVSAQTGGITVKVVDSNGDPLPAATVTISHPTGYVGETAALTNARGVAVFPVLRATGQSSVGYTINVVFPGFAPMKLQDIKVSMGDNTKQAIQLSEEMVERVSVVATTDVVDLEDTSQSTKFTDEFIQDLPVPGRFYQNVLTLAPGVQDADGDGNPNVHGSRDRDFKAEVSGVSNVDPLTGRQMSQVNPNSIEEMEVITAGAGVEFSRAQGGFARILQKQGSNEFEGVLEFYYRSSLLDGTGANDLNNVDDPSFDWIQPSFQVSGPIVKDKLWYRLSHEWIQRDLPQPTSSGIEVVTDNQQIHSDQITWQASPRNKLAFSYQADPRQVSNFGVTSVRPAESAFNIDNESQGMFLTWTAPYSPKILIESQVAWQDFNVGISPSQPGQANKCLQEGAGTPDFISRALCFNLDSGEISGSSNQDIDDHRQRLTVRGDATVYGGRALGASHQLKFGAIVENERYTRKLERRPFINIFVISPSDDTTGEGNEGDEKAIIFGNFSAPEFTQITARGITWGFYAEDQIKPTQNFTATLGIRIDREEIRSDGWAPFDPEAESAAWDGMVKAGIPETTASSMNFTKYEALRDFFTVLAGTLEQPFQAVWTQQSPIAQESQFWDQTRRAENITTANTNIAPRISLSWDPWSDGKTKFAATAGRYYDKIFLNIPLLELQPANTNIAFNTVKDGAGWNFDGVRTSVNPAVNIQSVDRSLKTPYQDEWTLQVERQLWAETSVKATYINRKFRDQLQDFDLNHAPADLGRCVWVTQPGQNTVEEVRVGDAGYVEGVAPGDGIIDDCIGELEAISTTGEGGIPEDESSLQRPDQTADLYVQNPGWGDIYRVSNFNEIDYEAVVLELIRRQYRSWEMQASYTYSRAIGDGEDFGQPLGDDRSLIEDEKGFQAYDQRHVVKVNATTITPWGFRLGTAIQWQSGLPFSILQRWPAIDAVPPRYENLGAGQVSRVRTTYVTGQRNDQRNSSYLNVDVRFTKEFTLGRNLNMQIAAEIFNLLNDGTYQIYDPATQTGEQVNGINNSIRRFGRRWQIGLKFAF